MMENFLDFKSEMQIYETILIAKKAEFGQLLPI